MKMYTHKDTANVLLSPLLVNEYVLPYGNVWGNLQDGFAIDLMEVWRVMRRPKRMHPLNWLSTLHAEEAIRHFENNYKVESFFNGAKIIPLFPDLMEGELEELTEGFRKDPDFDDGRWSYDSDFTDLLVSPYIAHFYVRKIYKRFKHTLILRDLDKDFHYRGYTIPASIGNPVLYLISDLAGRRIRGSKESELLSEIRRLRKTHRARREMHPEMHFYGNHIMRRYWDTSSLPSNTGRDLDILCGLWGTKSEDSKIYLSQSQVTKLFEEMRPIRESLQLTRRGTNAHVLVSENLTRWMIEELLFRGKIGMQDLSFGH